MNSHRRPCILIADHDRSFLDQLVDRLLRMHVEVDVAENGRTAMRLIEAEDYDLIISEVAMPLNNGLEILAKAKEFNPQVAFLMLSYEMTKDFAEQSLQKGAFAYIVRPFKDFSEFDQAVMRGLKQGVIPQGASPQPAMLKEDMGFEDSMALSPTRMAIDDAIHAAQSTSERTGAAADRVQKRDLKAAFEVEGQPSEMMSSIPEGMIEVNQNGQILSCNPAGRKWLELDAKTQERPIKSYLKSLASGKAPSQMLLRVNGHQAYILRKQIEVEEGRQRIILLFREAQNAPVPERRAAPAARHIQPSKSNRTAAEVSFSASIKKAPIETYSQGWSPVLFFDSIKKGVKGEVNRFIENNPIDWIHQFHRPNSEEMDPEVAYAVNHRLSHITGAQRSPYNKVT